MGKRIYGSLTNRLEEGKNYTGSDTLQPGTDITMYYWSDRKCYYITRVIDNNHFFVKQYHVCANHDKDIGMGHEDWMYFKTAKEEAEYLKKHFPDREYGDFNEYHEEEWMLRYNKWKSVDRWNTESIEKYKQRWGNIPYFTDKEWNKINSGNDVCRYHDLEPISFGVRSYYYDWSF